jgi:hypothetical protein
MKKRPPYYEGSENAPDLAENEPAAYVDIENQQIDNLRSGIGELFDILEDKMEKYNCSRCDAWVEEIDIAVYHFQSVHKYHTLLSIQMCLKCRDDVFAYIEKAPTTKLKNVGIDIIKLAEIYKKSCHHSALIAEVCDTALDRSGRLLGEVRKIARNEEKEQC